MTVIPQHHQAIATRTFRLGGSRDIVAVICSPVQVEDGRWQCEFRIDGLDEEHCGFASGVDGLQALIMSFQGLRRELEALAEDILWDAGEPDETGIPMYVPGGFGRTIDEQLEKLVVDETNKFLDARKASRNA